jgi:hypothetical protein
VGIVTLIAGSIGCSVAFPIDDRFTADPNLDESSRARDDASSGSVDGSASDGGPLFSANFDQPDTDIGAEWSGRRESAGHVEATDVAFSVPRAGRSVVDLTGDPRIAAFEKLFDLRLPERDVELTLGARLRCPAIDTAVASSFVHTLTLELLDFTPKRVMQITAVCAKDDDGGTDPTLRFAASIDAVTENRFDANLGTIPADEWTKVELGVHLKAAWGADESPGTMTMTSSAGRSLDATPLPKALESGTTSGLTPLVAAGIVYMIGASQTFALEVDDVTFDLK